MADREGEVRKALGDALGKNKKDVDESMFDYIVGVIAESSDHYEAASDLEDIIGPFLGEAPCFDGKPDAVSAVCRELVKRLNHLGGASEDAFEKLDSVVVLADRDLDAVHEGKIMLGNAKDHLAQPINLAAEMRKKANEKDLEKAEAKIQEKLVKQAEEEEKKQLAILKKRREAALEVQSHVTLRGKAKVHDDAARDIRVEEFNLAYGGFELLKDASLFLNYGRRYGLVGRNGVGKTSLLRHLANRDLPIPSHMSILCVQQEVTGDDTLAIDSVLQADVERTALLAEEAELARLTSTDATTEAMVQRLAAVQERLEEIDAHKAPARAGSILAGLQFDVEMQRMMTREFSGGWRMRLALARALFRPPDLLILDEPTNHLDLYACVWLEEFLKNWSTTLLLVSHDRLFLNSVCTDIVHMQNQQLHYYRGNYDSFAKVKAQNDLAQERAYENQQKQIEHMEKFITKFRYKAKGASMAQSRIKALEKMERVEEVYKEDGVSMTFENPEKVGGNLVDFQEASFGYDSKPDLLHHLNFHVDVRSRVTLLGPNGSGKSTLLKLFTGDLEPRAGFVIKSNKMRCARFEQHFVDQLDMDLTALEYFKMLHPDVELQDLRAYLGRFGVTGDLAIQTISSLSGGQKSRVVFAKIAWGCPNLLMLDEPTNHLDMETVDALAAALNAYTGGVILISHDQRLISLVSNELWVLKDRTVTTFDGSFVEYRAWLAKEVLANAAATA